MVVLGIFDSQPHALCGERIFQMSDGATRVFVMPYSRTQHMWQVRARGGMDWVRIGVGVSANPNPNPGGTNGSSLTFTVYPCA